MTFLGTGVLGDVLAQVPRWVLHTFVAQSVSVADGDQRAFVTHRKHGPVWVVGGRGEREHMHVL